MTIVLTSCQGENENPPEQSGVSGDTGNVQSSDSGESIVLFLGDSLTAGYGVDREQAYPVLIGKRWRERGLSYTVRNAAISGATTKGALENLLHWHLKDDIHAVFLCIGANDGLRGLKVQETRKNLETIIQIVTAKKIPLYFAGMKLPPNYGKDYTDKFEAIFPQLAEKHKLNFLPFLLEGVPGSSKSKAGRAVALS